MDEEVAARLVENVHVHHIQSKMKIHFIMILILNEVIMILRLRRMKMMTKILT